MNSETDVLPYIIVTSNKFLSNHDNTPATLEVVMEEARRRGALTNFFLEADVDKNAVRCTFLIGTEWLVVYGNTVDMSILLRRIESAQKSVTHNLKVSVDKKMQMN